jgi:hypothetical protein
MIPRFLRRHLQTTALNHGVQISRHRHDLDSYFVSKKYEDRLIHRTAQCLDEFLTSQDVFPIDRSIRTTELTRNFYELYKSKPNKGLTGSSGFNSLLSLFSFTQHIQPDLIVESGVFIGQSTWCLRNAAPDATINSFDIDLSHLQYTDPSVHFHEHDWSEFQLPNFEPDRAICFMDDHVDQVRRLLECHERGFKYVCFDDNTPVEWLHLAGDGAPMFDFMYDEELEDGEVIKWQMDGARYGYEVDLAYLNRGKAVVDAFAKFPVPTLTQSNGFSIGIPLTIVRLKSSQQELR